MKASNIKINKLAVKYVIPYLVVLFIALLTGTIVYNKTSQVLQNEVEKSNIVLLEQGMAVLDNRMKEADLIIRRISDDTSVGRLQQLYEPFNSENLYKIIETQKRLKEYSFLNNFISQYYIVFKNSNLVLSDYMTVTLSDFKDIQYINREKDYFQNIINEYHYKKVIPAQEVLFQGRAYSAITYLHSFGFSAFSQASVILILNYEEISKLFQGIDISNGGWAYITDEQENVIAMVSDQPLEHHPIVLPPDKKNGIFKRTMDSKDIIVTYVTSEYNNWTYVAAQPAEIVLEKINYIKKITLSIVLVFLFVGITVASYLAYRNSKPVHALLRTNAELEKKIQRQLPYIRTAFFDRLLKGEFNAIDDIKTLMKHVKVNLNGHYYVVAIIYIREEFIELNEKVLERLAKKKLIVKESVALYTRQSCYFHDIDEDKIALIFSCNEMDKGEVVPSLSNDISNLQRYVHDQHHIISVCSLGNVYENLVDISSTFYEAEQALVRSNESQLILFQQIDQDDNRYYYPENVELRLINCVKSGNTEQLNVLLGELYNANFLKRNLPVLLLKLWLFDMWASLVKIVEQISIEEMKSTDLIASVYKSLESKENLELNYQNICKTLIYICEEISEKNKGKKSLILDEIKDYINRHYSSSDVSLAMIADTFNLSEAYLSRSFKEQAGLTIIEYLENKRIERSKELLFTTELNIGEIALAVGYNSLNTFGRAFKRATGVSAKTYRELHKK